MTRATRGMEYIRPTSPGTTPRVRVLPARDLGRLGRDIAEAKTWFGLRSTVVVRSCYEAGRDGFWLHRYLTATGIDNQVVDSASIEVNRRRRRAKSDGLDVRKLLTMLRRYHAGEPKVWSVVRVPTVDEEDRRHLHRELRTLKKDRTRVTNRVKGLLANQGIRLTRGQDLRAILEHGRLWDGSALPPALRARLQREWEHAQFLHGQILELERERQRVIAHGRGGAVEKVRQLLRLRAIGPSGAWVYVNEFFGWRQFRNGKEVGAAAGLVPTPTRAGTTAENKGSARREVVTFERSPSRWRGAGYGTSRAAG